MLIWGSGSGVCIAGEAGMRECPVCGSAQRFDLSVSYGYAHIWYLFSWVTRRKYLCVCSRCHNGLVISRREFQQRVVKDPIPIMRRRGWVFIPIIIGIFVLLGALQERRQAAVAAVTNADEAAPLTEGSYRDAVMQAVRLNWMHPDDTPALPCRVSVGQEPGGHVTRIEVAPDCPYSEAGKRSVISAVRRADPLPYKGYERFFSPTIDLTFASNAGSAQ